MGMETLMVMLGSQMEAMDLEEELRKVRDCWSIGMETDMVVFNTTFSKRDTGGQ